MSLEKDQENLNGSVKRAADGFDEPKFKVPRTESETKTTPTEESEFGEGELEVEFVDPHTGETLDDSHLSALDYLNLIQEELTKIKTKLVSKDLHNNYKLGELLEEDEKNTLIKLFETAFNKFEVEKSTGPSDSSKWWTCYIVSKLTFGQLLSLGDIFDEAYPIAIQAATVLSESDPSPFLLLGMVKINQLAFSIRKQAEDSSPTFPSNASDELNEIGNLSSKVFLKTRRLPLLLNNFYDSSLLTKMLLWTLI